MLTSDPYELGYIYIFALDYENRISQIKTSGLVKIEEAFNSNIGRLKAAMLFPAFSGHLARYMERCITIAQMEIDGKATADLELNSGTAANIIKRSREIMREADTATKATLKTKEEWEAWIRSKIEIGAAPASLISTKEKHGIQAFLSSFVTGGWTIIETMAGDLWEESLNSHPSELSALRGNKTKFYNAANKKNEDRPDNQQIPDQRIRLETLERFSFDLREGMGTALRGDQRLDSLGGIRESYARTFSKDFDSIQTAVMDKAFDRLNIVRNLIVHRGTITDATYIKAMEYVDNLPPATLGKSLELNGKIVANLLADAFDGATKLIAAIDNWISIH